MREKPLRNEQLCFAFILAIGARPFIRSTAYQNRIAM
jgi:hypothetical protein